LPIEEIEIIGEWISFN